VTRQFLDRERVGSAVEQQRDGRVPEVVEPRPFDPGLLRGLLQAKG